MQTEVTYEVRNLLLIVKQKVTDWSRDHPGAVFGAAPGCFFLSILMRGLGYDRLVL